MPKIGRTVYNKAIEKLIEASGYRYHSLGICKKLIYKDNRIILIDVAGKNLPYIGSYGEEAFPWETHLEPSRLDRLESNAESYQAEPWIAFCYAVLRDTYESSFEHIVTVENVRFGTKLISTIDYKNNMDYRSPSWRVVDLPREKVLKITCDLNSV